MNTLYSFRRCPYAIRARMALLYAKIPFVLREIKLSDKPEVFKHLSPKATVPVLQLIDGRVLDESLDIIDWALSQNDPDGWRVLTTDEASLANQWIEKCDGGFKAALDQYKYPDRYPGCDAITQRQIAETFINCLERHLQASEFLLGPTIKWIDIAIFPLIRQFANVDGEWFAKAPYPQVRTWLHRHLQSDLFTEAMRKHPVWQPGDSAILINAAS